jgi:hypothetical protein
MINFGNESHPQWHIFGREEAGGSSYVQYVNATADFQDLAAATWDGPFDLHLSAANWHVAALDARPEYDEAWVIFGDQGAGTVSMRIYNFSTSSWGGVNTVSTSGENMHGVRISKLSDTYIIASQQSSSGSTWYINSTDGRTWSDARTTHDNGHCIVKGWISFINYSGASLSHYTHFGGCNVIQFSPKAGISGFAYGPYDNQSLIGYFDPEWTGTVGKGDLVNNGGTLWLVINQINGSDSSSQRNYLRKITIDVAETNTTLAEMPDETTGTTINYDWGGLTPNTIKSWLVLAADNIPAASGPRINFTTTNYFSTANTAGPVITLHLPENKSNETSTTILFNWTATDDYFASVLCNLSVNNDIVSSDLNVSNNTWRNVSIAGLTNNADYQWNVTCVDDGGASNSSDTYQFTINATVPGNVTEVRVRAYDNDQNTFLTVFNVTHVDINDSSNGTAASAVHSLNYSDNFDDSSLNLTLWNVSFIKTSLDGLSPGPCASHSFTETTALQIKAGSKSLYTAQTVLSSNVTQSDMRAYNNTRLRFDYNWTAVSAAGEESGFTIRVDDTDKSFSGTQIFNQKVSTSANQVDEYVEIISDKAAGKIFVNSSQEGFQSYSPTEDRWFVNIIVYATTDNNGGTCTSVSERFSTADMWNLTITGFDAFANYTENETNIVNTTWSKAGFKNEVNVTTLSGSLINMLFSVAKETLTVTLRDEVTYDLIDDVNFTISFIDGVAEVFNITNGTITFTDILPPDQYILRYSGKSNPKNYSVREFFVNFLPGTANTLTLFSIKDTDSTVLPLRIVDLDGREFEGAEIHWQRYFIETNSYETVEMTTSGDAGISNVLFEPFDAWYKIVVLVDDTIVRTVTPRRYTTTDAANGIIIDIDPNIDESPFASIFVITNLIASTEITYDRPTRAFTYTYADTSGILDTVCLRVFQWNRRSQPQVNETCSNSSSATIVTYHPALNKTFEARVFIETTTKNSLYTSIFKMAPLITSGALSLGAFGVFLATLIVATMSMASGFHPSIPIGLLLVGLLATGVIFGLGIALSTLLGIAVAGIAAIIAMSWRQTA